MYYGTLEPRALNLNKNPAEVVYELDRNKGDFTIWQRAFPKALKPNRHFPSSKAVLQMWVMDNAYFPDKNFISGLNF